MWVKMVDFSDSGSRVVERRVENVLDEVIDESDIDHVFELQR